MSKRVLLTIFIFAVLVIACGRLGKLEPPLGDNSSTNKNQ